MGPALFVLYINDAKDPLPKGVDLAAYADDTTRFQCLTAMENIDHSSAVPASGVCWCSHYLREQPEAARSDF